MNFKPLQRTVEVYALLEPGEQLDAGFGAGFGLDRPGGVGHAAQALLADTEQQPNPRLKRDAGTSDGIQRHLAAHPEVAQV